MEKNMQEKTKIEDEKFLKTLEKKSDKLVYLSETDAFFTIFKGKNIENLSKELFLLQTGCSPNVAIEEQKFDDFFFRLTALKDWFGEIEKQRAKRFQELREFLESNLKELKIFRIGKIKIDIYIVGIDANNNLVGLKTNAVET